MIEATWGGEGLLYFLTVVHDGRKSQQELKQDRVLEAGAAAEAMEACCSVACSPWIALIESRTPLQGWHHGLYPLS